MNKNLMMASLIATAGIFDESGIMPEFIKPYKEPKNKYSLSSEQIYAMEGMTPKEKKKFLRDLQEEKGE